MKSTVIDVLIFLFEHYIDDEIALDQDRDRLGSELRKAGFDQEQVNRAFDWLADLSSQQSMATVDKAISANSVRIFTFEEEQRLDVGCRGFLWAGTGSRPAYLGAV